VWSRSAPLPPAKRSNVDPATSAVISIGACNCLSCLSRTCEPGEGGPGAEHSALQSFTYTPGLPSTQAGDARPPASCLDALCLRAAADVPYIRPAAVFSRASTAIHGGMCSLRSSTVLLRMLHPRRAATCYSGLLATMLQGTALQNPFLHLENCPWTIAAMGRRWCPIH